MLKPYEIADYISEYKPEWTCMRQLTLTATLEYYDVPQIITDDADAQTDTYQLEVPAHDRITFSTLISRMGWHASSLGKNLRKIAAL